MAIHISELSIDTYRGIKNLDIKDLGDINIITGDNNCGKTSILEVIRSLEAPTDLGRWSRIRSFGFFSGVTPYSRVATLFNINDSQGYISYTVVSGDTKEKINIKIELRKEHLSMSSKELMEIDKDGAERFIGLVFNEENEDIPNDEILLDVERSIFDIYYNKEHLKSENIYNFERRPLSINREISVKIIKTKYISPVEHGEGNVFLTSILNTPKLYQEMIEILKEFDENIISINADKTEGAFGRTTFKILSSDHNLALPLNVYGDGMKKAILLMSAVVLSKDGILLLDEFETAIHTSAMDKVFAWILKTCKKLNVQLFLTSHSKEAIDKVLKCAPELQKSMRLITLYKKPDKVVARVLDGLEAIETQDELGLELR